MTDTADPSAPAPDGPDFGIPPDGYRLPPAARTGPVRLRVADLERSLEFYGRVLGLEPLEGGGTGTVLGAAPGREPLVVLVERPGVGPAPPGGRPGLFHFALRVPDRGALGRFLLHARDLGLRMGTADHRVSEALYLNDPDGLGIEVYADRPRSAWSSRGRQLVLTTEPLDEAELAEQAGSGSFDGLPAGTAVGHVHLHVGDLEGAERFYHDGLGFDKVVWDYPGALFLSAGGYHHHVGTNTWAADSRTTGPETAGLESWTLVVPGEDDVAEVSASLERSAFAVSDEDERGRRIARDPWGTAVEVVAAAGAPPLAG